jgi:DNA repair protein RecN (Recombination protein N)
MLRELRVGNLALFDDLTLPLDQGLTILTGETGAGKSLIAGALSLLAGGKGEKEIIRQGEDLAFVEGLFDLTDSPELANLTHQLGIRLADDGILVLRRELRREGRGRVLINGLVSSLALLEQLGPELLSVQSQDQQRILQRGGFARDFLDSVLGLESQREKVGQDLGEFQDLARRLALRLQEAEFSRQQLEMWEYQLRELEEADLDLAEESQLGEKIALGRNSRSLLEGAELARQSLSEGEANASQLLGAAASALARIAATSPRLEAIHSLIQEAQNAADEAGGDLERFLDSVDVNPAKLDELEERQSLYASLQRKYDRDVAGLLDFQDSLRSKVGRQKSAATDIDELSREVESARQRLTDSAQQLRKARLAGCKKVASRARDLIRELALPELDLVFEVGLRPDPDGQITLEGVKCKAAGHGSDQVILLARTNRGEAYGEVGRIASGGEKSRIYLGLSVLAGAGKSRPLLLFDEIDAGLGMDNAIPVARLLAKLAEQGQVLCITHLPTVAAFGRQHLKVSKGTREDRTAVSVRALADEERVGEIARLLGGDLPDQQAVESQVGYAKQLLAGQSGK